MSIVSESAYFMPPGYRVCVVCQKSKPITVFYGDTKICPTCNASVNITEGERIVSEATEILARPAPSGVADPVRLKKCYRCKALKPLSEFYKNATSGDGHGWTCKPCAMEYQKKYYHKSRAAAELARAAAKMGINGGRAAAKAMTAEQLHDRAVKAARARWGNRASSEQKTCVTCGRTKARTEFYANRANKDGLAGECKPCKKEYQRLWWKKTKRNERQRAKRAELAANRQASDALMRAAPTSLPPAHVTVELPRTPWWKRLLGIGA